MGVALIGCAANVDSDGGEKFGRQLQAHAVVALMESESPQGLVCSGTRIGQGLVLTTAECARKTNFVYERAGAIMEQSDAVDFYGDRLGCKQVGELGLIRYDHTSDAPFLGVRLDLEGTDLAAAQRFTWTGVYVAGWRCQSSDRECYRTRNDLGRLSSREISDEGRFSTLPIAGADMGGPLVRGSDVVGVFTHGDNDSAEYTILTPEHAAMVEEALDDEDSWPDDC